MEIKVNQYSTLITDRYNGKYQIKVGSLWNDGQFHQDFKQIKKKDGSMQNIPVTITFDDDDTAKKFLLDCLQELGEKKEPPQSDVPF